MPRFRAALPAFLALVALPAGAASRIVVPEATWNAGIVAKGEPVRHTFAVRNEGATDLHLTEVRPSCGCTAAEFDRIVAPGREGKITLVVETRSFQGPISKSALVLSDDPSSPQTTLLVTATVKPVVDVLPGGFLRLQSLAGEKASAEVTVASDDPAFEPSGPEVPKPWMSAEVTPLAAKDHVPGRGQRQFRVRVTATADAPEGLLGGAVKLRTGIERSPGLEIPLAGFIRPTVAVNTGRIHFHRFVPEGDPVRRTVILTNHNPKNEAFAVTGASVSIADIGVEVVPIDRLKVQVVLTVDPKIRKGEFDGTLIVKTNDPVKREIRLPVTGTVLVRAPEGAAKG
jgi:hypothetical protein